MKKPEDVQTRPLSLRLSDAEKELLQKKATEANMSESGFIRNAILYGGAHEVQNFSKDDADRLIYEIDRIGNNLLQIDYWRVNSTDVDEAEWIKLKNMYLHLLSALFHFVRSHEINPAEVSGKEGE